MTTTIDLVLNAYNEIESIEKDLNEIFSIKNSNNNIKNVIIVEDGSSDGTSEKLRELEQIYNFTLSQSKKKKRLFQSFANRYKYRKFRIYFF